MTIFLRNLKALLEINNYVIQGFVLRLFTPKIVKKNNKESKEILYYSHSFSPRVIKISQALREQNYKVILISNVLIPPSVKDSFDETKQFSSIFQIVKYVINSECLFHVFINGKYQLPFLLSIVGFKKWVLDSYDVLAAYKGSPLEAPKVKLWVEKYCFEKAPKICTRSLEPQILKKKNNCKFSQIIFFTDYIPKKTKLDVPKNFDKFVYIGGVRNIHWANAMIQMAQLIKQKSEKASLTIYSNINENLRKIILKKSDNIKIINTVEYGILLNELKKYQVGLYFVAGKEYDYKHKFSMANKLYDYLMSSLIIASSKKYFSSWFIGRYVPYFDISQDQLILVSQKQYSNIDNLIMSNNINRLCTFYQQ